MQLMVCAWTTGKYCEDLSSSDESCSAPQRQRPVRKTKGPSIHEGPQALAKITAVGIAGKKQSRCGERGSGNLTMRLLRDLRGATVLFCCYCSTSTSLLL